MSLTPLIAISLYTKARSMDSTPPCLTLRFLSQYIYLIHCLSLTITKSSNRSIQFLNPSSILSNGETYPPIKFGHHRPDFVIIDPK